VWPEQLRAVAAEHAVAAVPRLQLSAATVIRSASCLAAVPGVAPSRETAVCDGATEWMDDVPPAIATAGAVSVPIAAGATVLDDEAGAWELLKRRVAENRKLSTENRKLRNDLGEARVRTPADPHRSSGCEILCEILRSVRVSRCLESRAGHWPAATGCSSSKCSAAERACRFTSAACKQWLRALSCLMFALAQDCVLLLC